MSTADPTTTSASWPVAAEAVATDGPGDQPDARNNAVTWIRRLPPRKEPLALGPRVVVTDHETFRGRLVERLLDGDGGAYVSALDAARRYRAALSHDA